MAVGSTLAGILLDRGDEAGARATVAELPGLRARPPRSSASGRVRARLLLAEGRAEEALAALDRQDAADSARRWLIGLREDSHVLRARALAALGRDDEARALLDREIAADPRARRRRAPRRSR